MRLSVGFVIACCVTMVLGFKILHDDGMVGLTKKPLRAPVFAVKGCFCHGSTPSTNVRVWICGPDTLPARGRALYTVNVAKDSVTAAGFNVAAFSGQLGVHDTAETRLMWVDESNPVDSMELTHVLPKFALGHDTVSWSFWYTAPSTGGIVDTLYADGNCVDLSGDPSGDNWNYAPSFLVYVAGTASAGEIPVARGYMLRQNYPNPFNPSTTITFELAADANVDLSVFDLTGRTIATLLDGRAGAGRHSVVFSSGGTGELASGVYFYRLTVWPSGGGSGPQYASVKKMLLVR